MPTGLQPLPLLAVMVLLLLRQLPLLLLLFCYLMAVYPVNVRYQVADLSPHIIMQVARYPFPLPLYLLLQFYLHQFLSVLPPLYQVNHNKY